MNAAADARGRAVQPPAGAAGRAPDRSLSRRQRLSDALVFREAFDRGRKFVGRFMVMWLRRGDGAALRLGVVASRRQFRRAVDRARVKRLLREAFRLNRHRFAGAYNVVLVARQALLTMPRQEAERDLLWLAGKAGLTEGGAGKPTAPAPRKAE